MKKLVAIALLSAALGCEGKLPAAKPDAVLVELAPDVVSSAEGSLHVRATVLEGNSPLVGWSVRIQISYLDRNGNTRTFAGPTAETDRTGALEHIFEGLYWEGSGTVTAEVLDDAGQPFVGRTGSAVAGEATFSVLDRTPPVVTILSPAAGNQVGTNLPVQVQVQVDDEIGVSRVHFEAAVLGQGTQTQSTLIASGSTSSTITFDFDTGGAFAGPTVTLFAMAEDLSGNTTAASPLGLVVDPAITIFVPAPLVATTISQEGANFLANPTAIEISPKDEGGVHYVYVTDVGGGTCGGSCVWKIHPTTGSVVGAPIITTAGGQFSGIAFDATGDNMYLSERQNRIIRLTHNGMTYATPAAICADGASTNLAQDPRHLMIDATDGIVVTETNDQNAKMLATANCAAASTLNDFVATQTFNVPWGVTKMAGGDYLVSDVADDVIYRVTSAGVVSLFETFNLSQPLGMDWLGTSTTSFANSVFTANRNSQFITASQGNLTNRMAAAMRSDPVDLDFYGADLFILAENPGRIYRVSGYQ